MHMVGVDLLAVCKKSLERTAVFDIVNIEIGKGSPAHKWLTCTTGWFTRSSEYIYIYIIFSQFTLFSCRALRYVYEFP